MRFNRHFSTRQQPIRWPKAPERILIAVMARSPQRLARILDSDAVVASWAARRRQDERIDAALCRLLPRQLASRLRIADATGAELVLSADIGAVAAMLRQRAPDLIAALRDAGFQFDAIRVRVKPHLPATSGTKRSAVPPDRTRLRPLADLARSLPAGSPLKAALTRFVRTVGD